MPDPANSETTIDEEEPPSSGGESVDSDSEASPTDGPNTPQLGVKLELIVDSGVTHPLSADQIQKAVNSAAKYRGFSQGTVGVRITNDSTIQTLNNRHLGHDYATDVISFGYAATPPNVEGELVVSVDTAAREASEANWQTANELLLYIVHGTLHITGMDDHEEDDRAAMRIAEQAVFLQLGIDAIKRCGADRERITDRGTGTEDVL